LLCYFTHTACSHAKQPRSALEGDTEGSLWIAQRHAGKLNQIKSVFEGLFPISTLLTQLALAATVKFILAMYYDKALYIIIPKLVEGLPINSGTIHANFPRIKQLLEELIFFIRETACGGPCNGG
jgi:hypothetical protein